MFEILATIAITWVFGTLWGWGTHKFIHQRYAGPLFKQHLHHHVKHYPCHDFTSDVYRQGKRDSSVYIFLALCIPIGIFPILLWKYEVISLAAMIVSLLNMAFIGFLNSWIHDTFHLNNHWLSKLPLIKRFYEKLVQQHYTHHKYVQSNFGIFSFSWDKILGSYRK